MKERLFDLGLGFLLLLGFDTLAQVSFKFAGMHAFPPRADAAWIARLLSQPWIYGAVAGYVGAFFTWIGLLRRAPVGPAFAASHLEVVSVLLFSALVLHERMGPAQLAGAALIVGGIVCLAIGERDSPEGHD